MKTFLSFVLMLFFVTDSYANNPRRQWMADQYRKKNKEKNKEKETSSYERPKAKQQQMRWERRRHRVEGCRDVFVVAAGSEVSVVFSDMGVNLDGPHSPMYGFKQCKVNIPATIEDGYAVTSIEQSLTYGYLHLGKASGRIRLETFWGGNRFVHVERIPARDVADSSYIVRDLKPLRGNRRRGCRGVRQESLTVLFSVQGRRRSLDSSLLIQLDGQDLRFQFKGEYEGCY